MLAPVSVALLELEKRLASLEQLREVKTQRHHKPRAKRK